MCGCCFYRHPRVLNLYFSLLCVAQRGGGGVNEGSDHVLVLYMYKLYHNNLSFSLCVAEGGGGVNEGSNHVVVLYMFKLYHK